MQTSEKFQKISPDLEKFMIEHALGETFTPSALDQKSQQIAVVAALTALGNAQAQLKAHINGALDTGCTINDVKEVILQMSAYSGFPTCMNGIDALQEVINKRKAQGIEDSIGSAPQTKSEQNAFEVGKQELTKLHATQVEKLEEVYGDFCPDLIKFTLEFAYGKVHSRDNLSKKYRQTATIAALTALGNARPQLTFHIGAGLTIGLSKESIADIILLMSVYAGFPVAMNAMDVLKEVLDSRKD